MVSTRRKPNTPIATSKTPDGFPVDTIPVEAGIRNLVVVTVPVEADTDALDRGRQALQNAVGAENLVIFIPEGCRLEVIKLTADEPTERAAVTVIRPNAKWNL